MDDRRGCYQNRCGQVSHPAPQGCCSKLQKQLWELDFALVETTLYLDAYPDCKQALEYYHTLLREREAVAAVVNEQCGPITAAENKSRTEWSWIKSPWPWELDAN